MCASTNAMIDIREQALVHLVERLEASKDATNKHLSAEIQRHWERMALSHRANFTAREAWGMPDGLSKASEPALARVGELILDVMASMTRLDEALTVESARASGRVLSQQLNKQLMELTQRIPESFWVTARCCPVRFDGHRLVCLVSEPIDLATLNALSRLAGAELALRVAPWEEVQFGIETLYCAAVPVAALNVAAEGLIQPKRKPVKAAPKVAKVRKPKLEVPVLEELQTPAVDVPEIEAATAEDMNAPVTTPETPPLEVVQGSNADWQLPEPELEVVEPEPEVAQVVEPIEEPEVLSADDIELLLNQPEEETPALEIDESPDDEHSDEEKERIAKKLKPGWINSIKDKFKKAS